MIVIDLPSIFCMFILVVSLSNAVNTDLYTASNDVGMDYDSYDYPKRIPVYHVRRDHYSNEVVSRGRLERIGGLDHKKSPISLSSFKTELQCSVHEPTLNGRRGIINILEMVRPTRNILELMCIWAETRCKPWDKCRELMAQFKSNQPKDLGWMDGDLQIALAHINLVRIMNNQVYVDWPWGAKRFQTRLPWLSMSDILFRVLGHINDMKDSAFFLGAEQPFLPSNFPFPAFSNSPSAFTADIPWPWFESTEMERKAYQNIVDNHPHILKNDTDSEYSDRIMERLPWEKRHSKAVYYGEMVPVRQIVFDQAVLHPELIEARWKCDACSYHLFPWNPLSNEYANADKSYETLSKYKGANISEIPINSSKVGYIEALTPLFISSYAPYYPGKYKYTLVLTGIEGKASSGRLAYLLAHSGAVVLMQENQFEYHFSSHLKPWVHYVPLSFTGADVVDKIKWLIAHDHLAKRIAKNAENFGKSFLRLEDYYCYVATALDTIATLEVDSDVLHPYEPYLVK